MNDGEAKRFAAAHVYALGHIDCSSDSTYRETISLPLPQVSSSHRQESRRCWRQEGSGRYGPSSRTPSPLPPVIIQRTPRSSYFTSYMFSQCLLSTLTSRALSSTTPPQPSPTPPSQPPSTEYSQPTSSPSSNPSPSPPPPPPPPPPTLRGNIPPGGH